MFIQFLGSLSNAGQPALWWYSGLGTSNQIQGDCPLIFVSKRFQAAKQFQKDDPLLFLSTGDQHYIP